MGERTVTHMPFSPRDATLLMMPVLNCREEGTLIQAEFPYRLEGLGT